MPLTESRSPSSRVLDGSHVSVMSLCRRMLRRKGWNLILGFCGTPPEIGHMSYNPQTPEGSAPTSGVRGPPCWAVLLDAPG